MVLFEIFRNCFKMIFVDDWHLFGFYSIKEQLNFTYIWNLINSENFEPFNVKNASAVLVEVLFEIMLSLWERGAITVIRKIQIIISS